MLLLEYAEYDRQTSIGNISNGDTEALSSGLGNIAGGEDEGSPEEDVGNEWNENLPENIDAILDLQEG